MSQATQAPRQTGDEHHELDERLLALSELTSAGLFLYADDRLLYVNPALASQLGYTVAEAMSVAVSQLLHPRSVALVAGRAAALLEDRPIAPHAEICVLTRDGQERWLEVTDRVVLTGGRRALLGTATDVTERRRAEHSLAESERKYRTLLDQAFDGIFLADAQGSLLTVNDTACSMSGWPREQLASVNLRDLLGDGEESYAAWWSRLQAGARALAVLQLKRRDGTLLPVEVGATLVEGGVEGMIRDVSERQRAEERQRLAATVFETSVEGILVTDPQERILTVNRAFTAITGWAADEVIGRTPRLLQSGRHDAHFYQAMWRELHERGRWEGEVWNRRKSGEIYAEWLSLAVVRDPRGRVLNYVGTFEDRLRQQAHYDLLTGLPNGLLLSDRLAQALASARREATGVAVLFVDLDRFKQVNDRHGHATGDLLLQEVARRLRMCVRETDTVSRRSGDEFVVLLPGLRDGEPARIVAQKIVESLSAPYTLAGIELEISPSIGVALAPQDGLEPEELLAKADAAMYRVKRRGRGSWAFHGDQAPGGQEAAFPENSVSPTITFELQRAASGGLRGVEARLAPCAGDVESAEPAAARAERLLRQTAACAGALADLPGSRIAVRVPGELWRAPHFAELAGDLRAAAGRLELLVDEAELLESPKRSSEVLAELVRAGVAAVADGFGAGSTNLLALAQLPLSAVRLAPRLSRLAGTPEEGALRAAISAARSLELKVIAAGVETQQQRQRLAQLGCDAFQGGAISGPLTRPAVEALLALER